MTLFRYKNPEFVFNHIHKAAGSSIRAATSATLVERIDGNFPIEWQELFSFAVVRNPIDRFFSAINMFRCGTDLSPTKNDFYNKPRIPKLTITQALDILEDPNIPSDRSIRSPEANLKHHLIPQCDPFRALKKTREILRHENLQNDIKAIADQVGIHNDLPTVRIERKSPFAMRPEDFSESDYRRFSSIYAEDFRILGYKLPEYRKLGSGINVPSRMSSSSSAPEPNTGTQMTFLNSDHPAPVYGLPSIDTDLEKLAAEIIPGRPGKTWAGREHSLETHFEQLESEFRGKPRICYVLACCIVCLRRGVNVDVAKELYYKIVQEHTGLISTSLNLRWLTSICDTHVDISEDPLERAIALQGSCVSALVKVGETERRQYSLFLNPDQGIKLRRGGELFDGVISYWMENGDMLDNLLKRIDRVTSNDLAISVIIQEIFLRVARFDTVVQRAMSTRGKKNGLTLEESALLSIDSQFKRAINTAIAKRGN